MSTAPDALTRLALLLAVVRRGRYGARPFASPSGARRLLLSKRPRPCVGVMPGHRPRQSRCSDVSPLRDRFDPQGARLGRVDDAPKMPRRHGRTRDRVATHSGVSPRAAHGCIARMMRKPNHARSPSDAALLLIGRWSARLPRTQPSCPGQADDARMMRKSNHVRSPPDAALLLFCRRLTIGSPRTRSRRPSHRGDRFDSSCRSRGVIVTAAIRKSGASWSSLDRRANGGSRSAVGS